MSSGIPERYKEASLDKIPDCPHKEKLMKYLNKLNEALKLGIGLYVHGEKSQGKTAIASIVLRKAMELNWTGYFISSGDMLECLLEDVYYEDSVLLRDHICSVFVLVIDDFVIYPSKQILNLKLEGVVRKRMHERLPTILTSNIFFDEHLKEDYQIFPSIFKRCMYFIECQGMNYEKTIEGGIDKFFG